MKRKYLPLYYQWLKDGMPGPGLCRSFQKVGLGYHYLDDNFFSDGNESVLFYFTSEEYEFNVVRQNIVLLLAAKNNEL